MLEILNELGSTRPAKLSKSIKTVFCRDIKVDFVNFPFQWISNPILFDNMVLANDVDIAAMKIGAITGRGSKKDFFDLHELLKRFALKEIMAKYQQKYPDGSIYLALKSLIYFEDAESQEDPIILNRTNWAQVKTSILQAHEAYMKTI